MCRSDSHSFKPKIQIFPLNGTSYIDPYKTMQIMFCSVVYVRVREEECSANLRKSTDNTDVVWHEDAMHTSLYRNCRQMITGLSAFDLHQSGTFEIECNIRTLRHLKRRMSSSQM
jgi:hypothetical protein